VQFQPLQEEADLISTLRLEAMTDYRQGEREVSWQLSSLGPDNQSMIQTHFIGNSR
jgi:hypothetical protein